MAPRMLSGVLVARASGESRREGCAEGVMTGCSAPLGYAASFAAEPKRGVFSQAEQHDVALG